jgi:hypothetical protein
MKKYIPKVGEAFEFYSDLLKGWYDRPKVLLITDKEVVYLGDNGRIAALCLTKAFRPIPTKTDVEREQLLKIIEKFYQGHWSIIAKEVQQAGFTIPPNIKRSDVRRIVDINSNMKGYEDEGLVTAICDLLGDLVEQDDKGGVE